MPDPNGGETLIPNPCMKWSDIDSSLPGTRTGERIVMQRHGKTIAVPAPPSDLDTLEG